MGEYPATGNTPLRRYVHGEGTDVPLIWYEGGAVSTSSANFLIADRQGTIAAVANASGAVTANYTYDPYGAPNTWGTVGTVPRFRYTGQAAIPEAQLYYYKARVYDPVSGRFLQTDPVGYGPDVNWYVYVGNDPVNGGDPSGEEPCTGTHIVGVTCAQSSSSVQSSGKVAAGSTQNGPGALPASGGNAINAGTLAAITAGIKAVDKKIGEIVSGGREESVGGFVKGAGTEAVGALEDGYLIEGVPPLSRVEELTASEAEKLADSSGVFKALPPPNWTDHHIFPQQFRTYFEGLGIDIDKYTITLERTEHLRGVHGNGLGSMPGGWNGAWRNFINRNPNATAKEVYQFAGKLMDQFGLNGRKIHAYGP